MQTIGGHAARVHYRRRADVRQSRRSRAYRASLRRRFRSRYCRCRLHQRHRLPRPKRWSLRFRRRSLRQWRQWGPPQCPAIAPTAPPPRAPSSRPFVPSLWGSSSIPCCTLSSLISSILSAIMCVVASESCASAPAQIPPLVSRNCLFKRRLNSSSSCAEGN